MLSKQNIFDILSFGAEAYALCDQIEKIGVEEDVFLPAVSWVLKNKKRPSLYFNEEKQKFCFSWFFMENGFDFQNRHRKRNCLPTVMNPTKKMCNIDFDTPKEAWEFFFEIFKKHLGKHRVGKKAKNESLFKYRNRPYNEEKDAGKVLIFIDGCKRCKGDGIKGFFDSKVKEIADGRDFLILKTFGRRYIDRLIKNLYDRQGRIRIFGVEDEHSLNPVKTKEMMLKIFSLCHAYVIAWDGVDKFKRKYIDYAKSKGIPVYEEIF